MAKGELNIMRKLGQFVKFKRKKLGWTQEKLCEEAFGRPDRKYISNIERGKLNGISFKYMEILLEVLDSDIEFKEL